MAQENETLVSTVPEFAAAMKIGPTKAWAMVHAGEVPVIRLGRSVRVVRGRLPQWVAERAAETREAGDDK